MTLTAPNFRLDGRRALVTGAGRGIGRAAAVALASAGASVTLCARSEDDLQAVAREIAKDGGTADYFVADVTDPRSFEEGLGQRPGYDILVNSAGMNIPKPLVELSDEEVEQIFNLNVRSIFRTTRFVLKGMLERGRGGSIIQISSQMGLVGSPGRTAYCASKHALEGMTKALAWEVGESGIRVNTICPTFIETDFTAKMFAKPGFHDWVTSRIALRRPGRTDEIMGAVVFLASDASSLMTGQALVLDGGWTAV